MPAAIQRAQRRKHATSHGSLRHLNGLGSTRKGIGEEPSRTIMYWFVYLDNVHIGAVIAADEQEAFQRAEEKFGPYWGILEVVARNVKHATMNDRVQAGIV